MAMRAMSKAASWQVVEHGLQDIPLEVWSPGRRQGPNRKSNTTNSQARVRTFGRPESEIRVKLYRDNHAWCPYCHKVWLQLEEKRIPYRIEKVNMRCYGSKSRDFLRKTPRGLLPAIEIDGNFFVESDEIMRLLEETFPDHNPLISRQNRARIDELRKLERYMFRLWLNWLCYPNQDAKKRKQFTDGLDIIDSVLSESSSENPYFCGEFSIIDCIFAPFLERMVSSLLYYKGFSMRNSNWPHLDRWFNAMETRSTYIGTKSDHFTHVHDLPPQLGGCYANGNEKQREMEAWIDGAAWTIPRPENQHEICTSDPKIDNVEAVGAYFRHHVPVQDRAVNATKCDDKILDSVMQCVCEAMLQNSVRISNLPELSSKSSKRVCLALCYIRDRIGVPRDMSTGAAMQLRGYINLAIEAFQGSKTGIQISSNDRYDQDSKYFMKPTL